MAILAIDLGTKTGWALSEWSPTVGEIITSGTAEFKPDRYSGGGMRFLQFRRWLTDLKQTCDLEAVYFEEVRRHRGVDAAHVYGGFLAHLTAWCENHEIPYQGVPVGTIKKHVTGKGNASKEEVMCAVTILSNGRVPKDDNEADALALLDWALERAEERA